MTENPGTDGAETDLVRRRETRKKFYCDKLKRKLKVTKVEEYSELIEINQPRCVFVWN